MAEPEITREEAERIAEAVAADDFPSRGPLARTVVALYDRLDGSISKAEHEVHDAFYRLTVKERDYERARVDRLTRENAALVNYRRLYNDVCSLNPLVPALRSIIDRLRDGWSASLNYSAAVPAAWVKPADGEDWNSGDNAEPMTPEEVAVMAGG